MVPILLRLLSLLGRRTNSAHDMQLVVFTDGGSRGNPGKAACAFVAQSNDATVHQEAKALGVMTNNEAEYHGFLLSLEWLKKSGTNQPDLSIVWKLDSKLVVEQLNRRWKIKEPRMRALADECWLVLASLPHPFTITHVPREENAFADALLNQTLDQLT